MPILILAGDVLWIISLSIMASASLSAWKRMDADTRVPMQFRADGSPIFRARRTGALVTPVVVALVFGMMLVIFNRNASSTGDQVLIFFGVRATLAALFAVYDLRWLNAVLSTLEKEGALKP